MNKSYRKTNRANAEHMSTLLIPSLRRGNGSGHLLRLLELSRRLKGRVALLVEHNADERCFTRSEIEQFCEYQDIDPALLVNSPDTNRWRRVIFDNRRTEAARVQQFGQSDIIIGIDEGGAGGGYMDFLINTLPTVKKESANIFSPAFIKSPDNRRDIRPGRFNRVLLTFGGEDRKDLSGKIARLLLSSALFQPQNLTVINGVLFNKRDYPAGIKVLPWVKNLREHLYQYDLVFTSYGLTAFEALKAGVPVVLINASRYHTELSRAAGLPDAGTIHPDLRRLRALLADKERLFAPLHRFDENHSFTLDTFIDRLALPENNSCPNCRRRFNPVVANLPRRSFYRCDRCGLTYQKLFTDNSGSYGKSYFFDDYKKQYGRTYIEDLEKIKKITGERLAIIEKITDKNAVAGEKSLLDVGCAFGAGLLAARDRGWRPFGCDIAADPVEYCRNFLKMEVCVADFIELNMKKQFSMERVTAVTMWYVIEHFANLRHVLNNVNAILPIGGVLAFSTPSLSGVSAKKSLKKFFANSPEDHFLLIDPSICRKLLQKYGFRVKKIRITGHHPERFPFIAGETYKRLPKLLRKAAGLLSRQLALGDTFEIYAQKTAEVSGEQKNG